MQKNTNHNRADREPTVSELLKKPCLMNDKGQRAKDFIAAITAGQAAFDRDLIKFATIQKDDITGLAVVGIARTTVAGIPGTSEKEPTAAGFTPFNTVTFSGGMYVIWLPDDQPEFNAPYTTAVGESFGCNYVDIEVLAVKALHDVCEVGPNDKKEINVRYIDSVTISPDTDINVHMAKEVVENALNTLLDFDWYEWQKHATAPIEQLARAIANQSMTIEVTTHLDTAHVFDALGHPIRADIELRATYASGYGFRQKPVAQKPLMSVHGYIDFVRAEDPAIKLHPWEKVDTKRVPLFVITKLTTDSALPKIFQTLLAVELVNNYMASGNWIEAIYKRWTEDPTYDLQCLLPNAPETKTEGTTADLELLKATLSQLLFTGHLVALDQPFNKTFDLGISVGGSNDQDFYRKMEHAIEHLSRGELTESKRDIGEVFKLSRVEIALADTATPEGFYKHAFNVDPRYIDAVSIRSLTDDKAIVEAYEDSFLPFYQRYDGYNGQSMNLYTEALQRVDVLRQLGVRTQVHNVVSRINVSKVGLDIISQMFLITKIKFKYSSESTPRRSMKKDIDF